MQLRWGVLGAGSIAHDFVTAVSTLENHTFVAVGARDKNLADVFARDHGIPKDYGSYHEVMQSDLVDIVYVAVVNSAHEELTIRSLKAGKHVVCEKPAGINVEECKAMVQTAQATGQFFLEGHWSRFFPSYAQLKKLVDSGGIGNIKYITGTFSIPGLKEISPANADVNLGGGPLYKCGYYGPALTTFLFDGKMPISIKASGILNEEGCDDSEIFTLTYANGAICQFLVASNSARGNCATIVGDKGGVHVRDFWAPATMDVYPTSIPQLGTPLPTIKAQFNWPHAEGLVYEAEHVRECLERGLRESPIMPYAQSMVIAKILYEIKTQIGLKHPQDIRSAL